MTPVLEIDNLSKSFGGFRAVDGVSLAVEPGEIFGFLGPNGAGKTTTIKMIAGLLRPDDGVIRINGHDLAAAPEKCKRDTGYIPDRPWLFDKLTGLEYLQFIASLYGLEPDRFTTRSRRCLELFELDRWGDHLIESYSHGMRQKLIMTSMLMLDQPLLVVDEPMVGLDPRAARIVKELLRQQARRGRGVFLSTHSLEIAEELCGRIGIIIQGRLRALGTMAELRDQAGTGRGGLEEIFLELTGSWELRSVIQALREE